MKIYNVQQIANGYAVYCEKTFIGMYNRKENAEFVARILEDVKHHDLKNYKYVGAKKL